MRAGREQGIGLAHQLARLAVFDHPVVGRGGLEDDCHLGFPVDERTGRRQGRHQIVDGVVAAHAVAHEAAAAQRHGPRRQRRIGELAERPAVERLGLDVGVAAAGARRQLQIQLRGLVGVTGAGRVKREARQPDAFLEAGGRLVEAERGGVHAGAHPIRDRLLDGGAKQGVTERRPPPALPLEHPHRDQLSGRDVGIQLQPCGIAPVVLSDADLRPLHLGQDPVDLVLGEIAAQQGREAGMLRQLRRERADLALGEPVGDGQIGQLRELVGGQEPDAVVGIAADDAVALEPANELGQQERAPLRPRDQRLEGAGGDVLDRIEQPARQLGRRVGRERAELDAHVVGAALAPARLGVGQRGARRHADPERRRRLRHGRVLDRLEGRVVAEVRVVEDHRQRAFARPQPKRLADAAADHGAQHAGRGAQRAQLGAVGGEPAERHGRDRPE